MTGLRVVASRALPKGVAIACALLPCVASALDLVGSYESALRADPEMLAADAAALAGREKRVQGNALLLPQLAVTGSVLHVDSRSDAALPSALEALASTDGAGRVYEGQLQLAQPLYDAQAWAQRAQLRTQSAQADLRHGDARQDLMRRVSEAYFNLLFAEQSLQVTQAEKATLHTQLERALARYDVGRGRITELQEAQARYDGVVAREISAAANLALRQAQYVELTAAPADALAPLRTDFVPAPPQPARLADWESVAVEYNVKVRLSQGDVEIARAETDKYRLGARPTLELVASYGIEDQDGGLSALAAPENGRTEAVGLQLSIPLFAGGAISSRLRESDAKAVQAERTLDAARRDARLRVQDAYLTVTTGVARIAALEQSVRSAQTALEATTLGRDVGTRTEPDVLDAQQRVYAAQLDLAQARNDYLTGRVRLAAAAGTLDERELQDLNKWLVPRVNHE